MTPQVLAANTKYDDSRSNERNRGADGVPEIRPPSLYGQSQQIDDTMSAATTGTFPDAATPERNATRNFSEGGQHVDDRGLHGLTGAPAINCAKSSSAAS